MKSPKERQRDYRVRSKEQKRAGLIKLKALVSNVTAKRLNILSEIDSVPVETVLNQAVEAIWSQRFGQTETVLEKTRESGIGEPIVTDSDDAMNTTKMKIKEEEPSRLKTEKLGKRKIQPVKSRETERNGKNKNPMSKPATIIAGI